MAVRTGYGRRALPVCGAGRPDRAAGGWEALAIADDDGRGGAWAPAAGGQVMTPQPAAQPPQTSHLPGTAGGPSGPLRRVALIGATGSIGTSALDVVARHPDRLRFVALAADTRWPQICEAARRFSVEAVALRDPGAARAARERLSGSGIAVFAGAEGVERVAAWPSADVTLAAPTGLSGLLPVLAALRAGKDVALANKESLVSGGRLVTQAAAASGGRLLPVDSEHSAIFQCLQGRHAAGVRRLWLTASGGPFRAWSAERLAAATPAEALAHPTWRMGPRITVDCATLFNKGLEVIEAAWLFGLAVDAVEVVVHPQSIVHSLVEFVDGSMLAQCGVPDMRVPILFALSYPERWAWPEAPVLNLAATGRLDFEPPDPRRFPCLDLVRAAGRRGGTAPAALNAADEVAVARFLTGDIGFGDIPRLLSDVLDAHPLGADANLDAVLQADAAARSVAGVWRPRLHTPGWSRGPADGARSSGVAELSGASWIPHGTRADPDAGDPEPCGRDTVSEEAPTRGAAAPATPAPPLRGQDPA